MLLPFRSSRGLNCCGKLSNLLRKYKKLPSSIGYIKSPQIDIDSDTRLDVIIDDQDATQTPLHCETITNAVRVNVGKRVREQSRRATDAGEKIDIDNLPREKELLRAKKEKSIPFFSYASEERFKDLFTALRDDAQINGIYIGLMVLSTMLAATGLYLDSASVIIGAMLLAPLMAPIVSLSMGILRAEIGMINKSIGKIVIGILIALFSSALITLLFPDKPVTNEMLARVNPTLLDLAVAIISGIAAAYSKSFKEIIQSLAGVAIAVALVPPLTVAGIGIGRLDFQFFLPSISAFFDQSGRYSYRCHHYLPRAGFFCGSEKQRQPCGRIYFFSTDFNPPLFFLLPHRGRSALRKKLAV